jgi:hypothetical protein
MSIMTDTQVFAQATGHSTAVGKYVYSVTIPSGFFGQSLPSVIADNKRDAEHFAREYALRALGVTVGRVIVCDRVKR